MLLFRRNIIAALSAIFLLILTGCLSTIIGTAVDVTIEAAKVPFKVAGAVISLASNDEDEEYVTTHHYDRPVETASKTRQHPIRQQPRS